MRKKVDFIKYVQRWGVIFLLGTGIALIIIDATYAYRDFRLHADQIRSDYIAHQKQVIKQEVMRVVDIIQYKKSQSEKITKRKIKSRVYEAFSIAQHIYQQYQPDTPEAEVQQMIVNAMRPIRFENGSGYYFITRFDGLEILFADRPGMEGRNLLGLQDTQGQPVVKDMIAITRQTGEGFYTYHWTKPGLHGNDFKKISYIKRFAPWDWLIGTGLYVDDIEAEIKSDLLADISRIRFGKEGYIFVNRLNGDALVSNGKRFSGVEKLWDVFNDNPEEMKAIFEKEYRAALKPSGDYIQYTHRKLTDPGIQSQKISYVLGVKDLQWLVGAGVYIDDVENEIVRMQAQLNHQLRIKLLTFSMTVTAILGLFYLFFSSLNRRLKKDVDLLISFFKRAANSDEAIDPHSIKFVELDQMAKYANKMLVDRRLSAHALRENEEKFRRMAENSPDIIYRMSIPDGRYEYVSSAAETITGYPPETWYANPLFIKKLIPSDWHDYFETEWNRLLQGHLSAIYDYPIIHKDQSLRWLNQRNVAIRNAAGDLVALEGIVTDRTVQNNAEADLRASQERFLKVLDSIDAAVNVVDMETHEILFMNRYMQENYGGDMTGDVCWAAFRNESAPCDACTHARLVDADGKSTGVFVWKDHNPITGKSYVNHDRAVEWTDGRLVRLQIATDITELTRMEQQLQQAQKMESVGRLAGGVAHDYNNMLSVILGYTELALENTAPGSPLHSDLEEIHKAAWRSIEITRQLLAFSRKQTIAPRRLDLNAMVEGMLKMLRRLVGENIHIVWHPGSRIDSVYMDPSQIDQILVNLCINARDAISDVGKITIETTTQSIDEAYCADHADATPGDFVVVAVSDDGCGMDRETQARLFEPFFTTKEIGKGTGLGLATIYGIVRQNNGFVNAYSEPGEGTTFRIYLPRYASVPEPVETPAALPSDARGTETILLVEDEHTILRMTQMMLAHCGYTVLTANNAAEALDVARGHAGPIDLIMTDVVMPDMNGKALSIRIQERHAGVKVLFMSGYTANIIAHRGVLDKGIHFIQKPFSRRDLAAKVREVLDGV